MQGACCVELLKSLFHSWLPSATLSQLLSTLPVPAKVKCHLSYLWPCTSSGVLHQIRLNTRQVYNSPPPPHTHTHTTDGKILASSEAGQLLKNSPDFRVTENATIPIQVSIK